MPQKRQRVTQLVHTAKWRAQRLRSRQNSALFRDEIRYDLFIVGIQRRRSGHDRMTGRQHPPNTRRPLLSAVVACVLSVATDISLHRQVEFVP